MTTLELRNRRLHTEYLPTSSLKLMPWTLRKHPKSQMQALIKSLKAYGQVLPILIDSEGRIISGAALWEAAKQFGMTEVMVIRIDHLSPLKIKALTVALNRLGELAKWEEGALRGILLELSLADLDFDIEATGFTLPEIELRIEGLEDGLAEGCGEEFVSSGPPIARLGELWKLGDHRLLCGDTLEDTNWQALMAEELAALIWTDPPFNVAISGHVSGLGKHRHREFAMATGEMDDPEFIAFLQKAMALAHRYSLAGALHYWAMDWRHAFEILSASRAVFEHFLNICVWSKTAPGMGSFYRSQHELFFVFAKGGAPSRNNVQLGKFGRSRSNIWSYPGAASLARTSEEGNPLAMHPTVKPLRLVCDVLLDASVRGDIVVDPFAGSGTMIIAAEKLGRKARCIELDPLYCDTIIRRWQAWTGEDAVRVSDGLTFAALEAASIDDGGDQ